MLLIREATQKRVRSSISIPVLDQHSSTTFRAVMLPQTPQDTVPIPCSHQRQHISLPGQPGCDITQSAYFSWHHSWMLSLPRRWGKAQWFPRGLEFPIAIIGAGQQWNSRLWPGLTFAGYCNSGLHEFGAFWILDHILLSEDLSSRSCNSFHLQLWEVLKPIKLWINFLFFV